MSLVQSNTGAAAIVAIAKAEPIATFPTVFAGKTPALWIGTEGTITVKLAGKPLVDVTFKVPAGVFPAHVAEIVSATATDILAIW